MAESETRALTREWVPEQWCDEVCAPMKATPDDFIVIDEDGSLRLGYAADDDDATDDDRLIWTEPVMAGDIVKFIARDQLGEIDVTFHADGSFTANGQIPEEHNHVWVPFDTDTICQSFDQLRDGMKSDDFGLPIGESMTLQFNRFSEPIAHRLSIVGGEPRFEQLPAAAARN